MVSGAASWRVQGRPSPLLLRANGPADMRRDAGELLEVAAEAGGETTLALFDKARFMASLRAQLDK